MNRLEKSYLIQDPASCMYTRALFLNPIHSTSIWRKGGVKGDDSIPERKRWQKCLNPIIGLPGWLDLWPYWTPARGGVGCKLSFRDPQQALLQQEFLSFGHSVSFMKTLVRRSHQSEAGRSQKTFLLPASTSSGKDTTLVAFSGLRMQMARKICMGGSENSLRSSKRKECGTTEMHGISQFPKASFLKRAGSRYLAIDTKLLYKVVFKKTQSVQRVSSCADPKQIRLSNQ